MDDGNAEQPGILVLWMVLPGMLMRLRDTLSPRQIIPGTLYPQVRIIPGTLYPGTLHPRVHFIPGTLYPGTLYPRYTLSPGTLYPQVQIIPVHFIPSTLDPRVHFIPGALFPQVNFITLSPGTNHFGTFYMQSPEIYHPKNCNPCIITMD